MSEQKKPKTIEDLNRLYTASEQVDSKLFAEQRSNVLLTVGEHYNKRGSKYWTRIREARELSEETKVRITRNHTQKIVKTYVNNIISQAPGVVPTPKNKKEQSDIKAAQLNHAIWQDAVDKYGLKQQTYLDALDFISIGEVACKVFWDPNAGKLRGYQQAVDEFGNDMVDEQGQPVASKTPVMTGDFVFERIYGFNLLRAREAKTMEESPYLCIRKMIDKGKLEALYADQPEKKRLVVESQDKTFMVFDGVQGGYQEEKNQVMIREFYWKPSYEYPEGYFHIATQDGILEEGTLPFGVYPIIYEGFDPAQTSARHFSIIKVFRPYQVEINRIASKMVEHQITTGDDKLLMQSGAKLSSGATLPGIRGVQYTGIKPEVMPGRTGDQYLPHLQQTISEGYDAVNLDADSEEVDKQADPFALLFRAMRDRKRFSIYAEKFERFQVSKCRLYLELAKKYLPDDAIVYAIGKNEQVNIPEFKSTTELCYQIKLMPMSDDIETMFGKQMVMNHALQYVGKQLDKQDIGRIIRNMPFGNSEESFSDLTLDYDSSQNMILALDRGQKPWTSTYDDADYLLKRLIARTRESDFQYLAPEIQQAYDQHIQQYEQIKAMQQQKLMEAEQGFIPSGGAKIKADYYVTDPNNPSKVSRAQLPAEAVDWLIKKLAEQGSSQAALQDQTQGARAEIAEKMMAEQQQKQGGMGMPPAQGPQTQGDVPPQPQSPQ